MPKLNEKLAEVLGSHPTINRVIESIDPNALSERDKPMLDWLDMRVHSYLDDPELVKKWDGDYQELTQCIALGVENNKNVLAASFLAGAAVVRKDINLRGDLDDSLYAARMKYQGSGGVTPGGGKPVLPKYRSSTSNFSPDRIAHIYKRLVNNMTPGGSLDRAIKVLLTDPGKVIRVGRRLHKLNVGAINTLLEECFGEQLVPQRHGASRSGDGQKQKQCMAPSSVIFKAKNIKCIKRQDESSSDEIFLTGFFYTIDNLEEVYSKIDEAVRSGRLDKIELDIKLKQESWQSDLYTGMREQSEKEMNIDIFKTRVHNGFCPWIANVICIEDDEAEYDAIKDTIDTIGDVADVVGRCASVTAAVSGPTPVSAAAGAVAAAAKWVSITADATSAVVSIVNYFDQDDFIGSVLLDCSEHDYYEHYTKGRTENVSGGSGGGRYSFCWDSHTEGNVPIERTWRYEIEKVIGPWERRDPRGWHGGKGDDRIHLIFNKKIDSIWAADVETPNECRDRHAEWKRSPNLDRNRRSVRGVVHWGVRSRHTVKYRAWVSGLRITNIL